MYMILFYCRVDKLNLDRMSDMSDIQAKIGLVGKSASRHLDTLRAQLFRECQTLFELATKPCSVVFDAFREDNYTEGICILLEFVQGVKSLGGYFACLCRGFEFYEVKKKICYYFSKRKWKYFYTFNHFYSEKSSKRAK